MNYKDIAIRALKTFVQAFVPVLIVAVGTIDITDISASKSVLYSALIAASSAGLSAVWNMLRQVLTGKKDETDKVEETEEIEEIEELPDDDEDEGKTICG